MIQTPQLHALGPTLGTEVLGIDLTTTGASAMY